MDILPDPNNKMNAAGELDGAGEPGPGYSNLRVRSIEPIMKDRTNSSRVVTRSAVAQRWEIDISYNPLTRNQFDIINSFLLSKRGGLIPFYVELPQYLAPKDVTLDNNHQPTGLTAAGSATINYSGGTGTPTRGDMFTISDPSNSSHTKAYMVLAEDSGTIYISPNLSRETSASASLIFNNPQIRVLVSDSILEHSLNTNNLYNISLKLEEAQV